MAVRRLGSAIFAPLALVSWLLSHCLAYQLVGRGVQSHHMLESGGHAGHAYLPAPALLLAAALALVLVGFVAAVVASARGARWSRISPGAMAAVPPVGFTVQEHVEQLIETGSFSPAALEPTFAVGLLLQLPLVLVAIVSALRLLATARRLGSGLRGLLVLRLRTATPLSRALRPRVSLPPAPWPLATRHAPRAPPLALVP
jgi:hypothetical protein